MHDEFAVRVRHGVGHLREQPQARLDVQRLLMAVDIDAPALDVLDGEIRLAVRGEAGVIQMRDVRMGERGENRRARAPCARRDPRVSRRRAAASARRAD